MALVVVKPSTLNGMSAYASTLPLPTPGSLEDSALSVMTQIQSACAVLVASVPERITRPIQLERALKLDKRLAWQIFRLGSSTHPLAEVANVPAAISVSRMLSLAEEVGIADDAINAVRQAFDRFDAFVQEHGGERAEVIAMIGGLGLEGGEDIQLKTRKALFKGNANVWGIQLATCVRTFVVYPSATQADFTDAVMIRGHNGMQRLRSGAPLLLQAAMHQETHFEAERRQTAVPQQPRVVEWARREHGTHGLGQLHILPEFSSQPLPTLVERTSEPGHIETDLQFPASGPAGAIQLYTHQLAPNFSKRDADGWGMVQTIVFPTETVVIELLVPKGWSDPRSASVEVYGRCGSTPAFDCRVADLLPQRERVSIMNNVESSRPVAGAPAHIEAVRSVLDSLGKLGQRFDLYRTTIQYPVLQSVIRLRVESVKN